MTEPLFHDILVPIDFSAGSMEALRLAGRLAGKCNARLLLLHVEPLSAVAPPTGMLTDGLWERLESVQDAICQSARESLQRLAEEVVPPGVATRARVLTGPAGQVILDVVLRGEVDLVVLGTHGRTGLPRVLVGSVAERVVRHSPVPVLVAKAAPRAED